VSGEQSSGDVVLVGESAEDLLLADPVHGEVDWIRRMGVSLSGGELAEGNGADGHCYSAAGIPSAPGAGDAH
jgi:hypothetical protein